MNTFAAVFKYLRERKGITQSKIGEDLNLSKSTISMYENGNRTPDYETLELIADYHNVSIDFLMGRDNSNVTKEFIPSHHQIEIVTIPLYDCIACGEMTFLEDDIIDYITLPSTMVSPNKEYFSNYAKGDSMIDRGIKEGDLLVFEKTEQLENGDIGSFCYQNEATCKIFRHTENGIILMPANHNFDPIFVTNNNFRIVGKLAYKISKEN